MEYAEGCGKPQKKDARKKMRSPCETAGVMDDEKRRRKEADKRSKQKKQRGAIDKGSCRNEDFRSF